MTTYADLRSVTWTDVIVGFVFGCLLIGFYLLIIYSEITIVRRREISKSRQFVGAWRRVRSCWCSFSIISRRKCTRDLSFRSGGSGFCYFLFKKSMPRVSKSLPALRIQIDIGVYGVYQFKFIRCRPWEILAILQ